MNDTPCCSVVDCCRPHYGLGYCSAHYQRFKRGSAVEVAIAPPRLGAGPDAPQWKAAQATLTYRSAHVRVKNAKGSARDHGCVEVDCPRRAYDWSYDNNDPDERIGLANGCYVRYSVDPDHYQPRCRPCHTAFDAMHRHEREAAA